MIQKKTTIDTAVIMSIYKNDKMDQIMDAVNSIINQESITPYFLIYVDGKIDNNVSNYLISLEKNNKIILFVNDTNNGLAYALNFLINKALENNNINYIARMDSDDISLPNRLITQRNFLDIHPNIDVLGTACEEFGAPYALEKKILPESHEDLVAFSITRCPFIHPTVMFRRNVFDDGNRYPTGTHFTEDMALWLDLIYKGYKFHNLQEVLFKYRLNKDTLSRRKGLSKAKSEISLRLGYMFILNKTSLKNMILITSRIVLHLLPVKLTSLLYKKLR